MTTPTFQSELLAILGKHRSADLYFGNHIPPEKLSNAVAHFPIPRREKVIGLIDCTVFGSCKVGLAITLNGFIWKNDWTTDSTQTNLTWQELVTFSNTVRATHMGVEFSPGINFNLAGSSVKPANFVQLCLALVDFLESEDPDSANSSRATSSHQDMSMDAVVIALLAKFCKTDGIITRNQIELIEGIFDGLSEGESSEKKRYIAIFNRAKDEDLSVHQLARRLATMEDDDEFFTWIYEVLWQIALTDDSLSQRKRDALREIPENLGLPREIYEASVQRYLSHQRTHNQAHSKPNNFELKEYFQLLGCAPNVSDADLKIAYRRKMSSLHPDKLQGKDLAEELMQFATEQVQKINYAYEQILKHRSA